jgi:hypothetical protein
VFVYNCQAVKYTGPGHVHLLVDRLTEVTGLIPTITLELTINTGLHNYCQSKGDANV